MKIINWIINTMTVFVVLLGASLLGLGYLLSRVSDEYSFGEWIVAIGIGKEKSDET